MNFGYYVRFRHEQLGMSVQQFAEACKMSVRQIIRIETKNADSKGVQITTRAGIAMGLRTTWDDLEVAWRKTPVPIPEFKDAPGAADRVYWRVRGPKSMRNRIIELAKVAGKTAEEFGGEILTAAVNARHPINEPAEPTLGVFGVPEESDPAPKPSSGSRDAASPIGKGSGSKPGRPVVSGRADKTH